MKRSAWRWFLVGSLALLSAGVAAAAASLGPLLDREFADLGGESPRSLRSFFAPGAPLVLIVWNSDCPRCLENLAQAGELSTADLGAPLVGVNFDASRWEALDFIQARAIAFPQLHDPEGRVTQALECAGESFSFAILDGAGRILSLHAGSVEDSRPLIQGALRQARLDPALVTAAGASGDPERAAAGGASGADDQNATPPPDYPLFQSAGWARARWLGVGVDDDFESGPCECGLAGPHGEELSPQLDILYRLTWEPLLRLAPGAAAGARIRISNEDPSILETGPQYLSSEYGSVFIELTGRESSFRLGYYDTYFSPFTLQRWDFADNPPVAGSGGAGGCGVCGAAVRSLSLAALDDLAPIITFEGAKLASAPWHWLRLQGLYARPHRPRPFNSRDPNQFAYRQDLWGARSELSWPGLGAGRARLGLSYVAVNEAANSSTPPPDAEFDPNAYIDYNEAYSVELAAPLPGGFQLGGEAARSTNRVDKVNARGASACDWAYRVELSQQTASGPRSAVAWLKLGPRYGAPFQALSYLPNTEGYRFSAQLGTRPLDLRIFYKRLYRIDLQESAVDVPMITTVASGLFALYPREATTLEISGTLLREERRVTDPVSSTLRCRCDKISLTLSARQEFGRHAHLLLEFNKLLGEVEPSQGRAQADLGIVELTVEF